MEPEEITERLLRAARAVGAETADALAVRGESLSVEVRAGRLEEAQRAEGMDLGLRVLVGRRQAVASASDARPETILALAERAVAMAREAPEDPFAGLADPGALSPVRDAAALDLAERAPEPEPAALERAAREAEAAALAVPGVTQVEAAGASWSRRRSHLRASNGFAAGTLRTESGLSAGAISGAGTGMERDWDWDSRVHQADLRAPAEIGRTAGERAAARQGPRRPRTGTYPVLVDERVASSLIGHLLSAINGTAVARGATFLRDALGEAVLPDGLSLWEEPHRPRVSGSRLWDAEGLPTARRALVEDGRLLTWTLDLGTGRRLGMASTANAARGTSSGPAPAAGNLRLTPGAASRADLLRDMGTGLWVTSFIGATVNPTTGDWSRGASGFWVENGEAVHPVSEVTVAGTLREMLRRIVPADDGREHLGRVVPSLLLSGLTVAGA